VSGEAVGGAITGVSAGGVAQPVSAASARPARTHARTQ